MKEHKYIVEMTKDEYNKCASILDEGIIDGVKSYGQKLITKLFILIVDKLLKANNISSSFKSIAFGYVDITKKYINDSCKGLSKDELYEKLIKDGLADELYDYCNSVGLDMSMEQIKINIRNSIF